MIHYILFQFFTILSFLTPLSICDDDDSLPGIHGSPSLRTKIHIAHGVIISSAIILFFPLGSMLLRILDINDEKRARVTPVTLDPKPIGMRRCVKVHVWCQCVGMAVLWTGFGLGCWLSWLHNELWTDPHMQIGTAVFMMIIFQPMLSRIHMMHIWAGRIILLLGVIAGGLGIRLASDLWVDGAMDIYIVLAGSVGMLWIFVWGWWYVEKTRGGVVGVWQRG